jgi:hypothetical protein
MASARAMLASNSVSFADARRFHRVEMGRSPARTENNSRISSRVNAAPWANRMTANLASTSVS